MVYLLLRVDTHGRVAEVAADQPRQRRLGNPDAPLAQGFRGRFDGGSEGVDLQLPPSDAVQGSYVRVPVHFQFRKRSPSYSQWNIYIPGPHHLAPWFIDDHMVSDNADALPGSGVFPVGSGLHLITPLGGA